MQSLIEVLFAPKTENKISRWGKQKKNKEEKMNNNFQPLSERLMPITISHTLKKAPVRL
jgi:hypothetical protein